MYVHYKLLVPQLPLPRTKSHAHVSLIKSKIAILRCTLHTAAQHLHILQYYTSLQERRRRTQLIYKMALKTNLKCQEHKLFRLGARYYVLKFESL
jgi:hypothetical protein